MHDMAIQDSYDDEVARCYGCGRLNDQGLHIRSFWERDHTVARFTPRPEHTATPGIVYGGLLASLVDCHGTGTASAAAARREGHDRQLQAPPRFVTASLLVDYLAPTPLGGELVLVGNPAEVGERKVVVDVSLTAGDVETVRGRLVAVRLKGRPG
ncbi:MAG: PaaI family thioesterase [Dermatophilaceae bacterium]